MTGKLRALSLTLALLCVAQLSWILSCISFFRHMRYLESPFFSDKFDTFMDLFNPLYWAFKDDRFTVWKSVYPPINFVFLQALWLVTHRFKPAPPNLGSVALRDHGEAIVPIFLTLAVVLAIATICTRTWKSYPPWVRALAFFAFFLAPPFLVGLERGNLVVLCPIFLALAIDGSAKVRRLCIPLLINIKPYLLILLSAAWRRGSAKEFWRLCALTMGVFILSALFFDRNSFLLFANILHFGSTLPNIFTTQGVLSLPSSVSAFTYALGCDAFLRVFHVDSHSAAVQFSRVAIDGVKWLALLFFLGVLALRAQSISFGSMLALLIVATTNLGTWVGGYTFVFYIACLPEFMCMRQWKLYLALIGLIFFPLDVVPVARMVSGVPMQHVFLSHAMAHISWTLGLGAIVRPLLNLLLLIALAVECLNRNGESDLAERCPRASQSFLS